MGFVYGDIVEYKGKYFEVIEDKGFSGRVEVLDKYYGRTGSVIENFKWVQLDGECKLIEQVRG